MDLSAQRIPQASRAIPRSTLAANFAAHRWRQWSLAASPTKEAEPQGCTQINTEEEKERRKVAKIERAKPQALAHADFLVLIISVLIRVNLWFQSPLVFLVSAGFGGRVHAVLRDFVDAASGRFLVRAVKVIEPGRAPCQWSSPFQWLWLRTLWRATTRLPKVARARRLRWAAIAEANVHPEPCVFSLLR